MPTLWRRPGIAPATSVWVLTRLIFLALTYFGVILFRSRLHGPHPSFVHGLLPAWDNRWDTKWYLDIARRGYAWSSGVGTSPTAFFPLYPLLVRIGVILSHRSYIVVALGLSNACFFGGLTYLWKLTAWERDAEAAGRTILYIATFPTALFFFAGYTESLFLFLTVASFYYLRRHQWLAAGALGCAASATRVTGVLLLVPFAYEYARASNFSPRAMLGKGLLGGMCIPTGLLAFMLYLRLEVGDAWAFSHSQVGWQKVFTLRLWAGIGESLRRLWLQPAASFYEAHNVINLSVAVLFLLATVMAARRLPAPYTLYLVAFWLVTLTSPAIANAYPVPLISMSRYVVILFPIFMLFGVMGERRAWHDRYLVVSLPLLALFTIQFLLNRWII